MLRFYLGAIILLGTGPALTAKPLELEPGHLLIHIDTDADDKKNWQPFCGDLGQHFLLDKGPFGLGFAASFHCQFNHNVPQDRLIKPADWLIKIHIGSQINAAIFYRPESQGPLFPIGGLTLPKNADVVAALQTQPVRAALIEALNERLPYAMPFARNRDLFPITSDYGVSSDTPHLALYEVHWEPKAKRFRARQVGTANIRGDVWFLSLRGAHPTASYLWAKIENSSEAYPAYQRLVRLLREF